LRAMPVDIELQPHPTLGDYYAGDTAKRGFLKGIFDVTAPDYDHVERMLSLGSGSWYRRGALSRAGLCEGMKVLDVAVGTGLVAREAMTLIGPSGQIIGLDPSAGMLQQAVAALNIRAILGVAEQLPMADEQFDFLSMGYALRHLSDLHRTFSEFFRVLKPGGRLCLLEITAPLGRFPRWLLRTHMRRVIPFLTRIATGRAASQVLWQYYWDTIEACVSPETLLAALREAGFIEARRELSLGIFSEYTARKPG
jgi:demethylmenaquinone methyltransferase / 2-methoxy-6-polyprenyl-1,4-benzoquinol methylase